MQATVQGAMREEARKAYPSVADEEQKFERPPAVDSDDRQFEVEKLIEKKRVGRGFQYLVKWRGYPESESSWQKKKDIHPDIVRAFEAGRLEG